MLPGTPHVFPEQAVSPPCIFLSSPVCSRNTVYESPCMPETGSPTYPSRFRSSFWLPEETTSGPRIFQRTYCPVWQLQWMSHPQLLSVLNCDPMFLCQMIVSIG